MGKKEEKKEEKKAVKIPKSKFKLKKDVSINNEMAKKGEYIWLTEIGRKSFKLKNYI